MFTFCFGFFYNFTRDEKTACIKRSINTWDDTVARRATPWEPKWARGKRDTILRLASGADNFRSTGDCFGKEFSCRTHRLAQNKFRTRESRGPLPLCSRNPKRIRDIANCYTLPSALETQSGESARTSCTAGRPKVSCGVVFFRFPQSPSISL